MSTLPPFKHAVEIGAGDRYSSQLLALPGIEAVPRVELYEPHELLCQDLTNATRRNHIVSINVAIGPLACTQPLIHLGYASYLAGLPSFLKTSCEEEAEKHWESLTRAVRVMSMESIDDGTIDYLVLTNNGGEMGCLLTMRSRPLVIRTRHLVHNAAQGEQLNLVVRWMMDHAYGGTLVETNEHRTLQAIEWRKI